MTSESLIYLKFKQFLRREDWRILGGQPPSGSDHLPVIEIRDTLGDRKGSLNAYKPDLVAIKGENIFMFELKPLFSRGDYLKLLDVLGSETRRRLLALELSGRGLVEESHALDICLGAGLKGALVNGDKPHLGLEVWQYNFNGFDFGVLESSN